VQYRHLRRNIALLLWDYIGFGAAFSLVSSAGAVIPTFVNQLTDSRQIVGLAGSLYAFCWLVPQLFLAQVVSRGTRRKPYMYPALFFRPLMVLMAMLVASQGAANPGLTLAIFLGGYWLFALGDSLVTLAWGDILGSSIPNTSRGLIFGAGQFGVAIGAIFMSELARWALGPNGPAFPSNYGLLFGVAGCIFVTGGIALSLIREEKSEHPIEPGPALREYVPYLGNVLLRDRAFQRFILTRLLFDLSRMAVPFYALYGIGLLGLQRTIIVSDSILLIEFGNAGAAILMGWLSRRSGSRAVILLAGVFVVLELTLTLLSYITRTQALLYGTFFMVGAFSATSTPSYFDWMITHAPPSRRAIYLGLTNTLSALSNLAPFVGGTILQISAQRVTTSTWMEWLGVHPVTSTTYPIVFIAALVMAVLGLLSAIRLSEPRRTLVNARD